VIKLSVKEVRNLKERIQGLIGRKRSLTLLIKTHFGIHTFGVKFPIDVLILNNENNVVSMREHLRPNRVFLWNPMYEKVIELPAGTIEKKQIKIHDPLDISIL